MTSLERRMCANPLWNRLTGAVVPRLLGDVPLAGRVLEVGGGAGGNAAALVGRHPGIERLVVTDIDPAMVEVAARRLAPLGPRAVPVVADTLRLPFVSASFDAVVSLLMLHHVVEWRPALAEIRRVLAPGGWFVGYDLLDGAPQRILHGPDHSPIELIGRGELAGGLARVGFDSVTVRPLLGGLAARFTARVPGS